MICKRVSGPSRPPVTLAEAKAHLNIGHDNDDTLIHALLLSAITAAEQETGRRLVTQTWDYYPGGFPGEDRLYLPWGSLQSVGGVYYTDTTEAETEWDAANYRTVSDTDDAGFIALPEGGEWPDADPWPVNPVRIRFTCGWHAGETWAAETATVEGDAVTPTTANGLAYQCATAGDTGTTEPAWPVAIGGTVTDGTVEWTCVGQTVPEPIKAAIKILLADLYQNRESVSDVQRYNTRAVEALLTPWRIWRRF